MAKDLEQSRSRRDNCYLVKVGHSGICYVCKVGHIGTDLLFPIFFRKSSAFRTLFEILPFFCTLL